MSHKDMPDTGHFLQRQLGNAGAAIDQYVVVDEQGCGIQIATNPPTASEYSEFHILPAAITLSPGNARTVPPDFTAEVSKWSQFLPLWHR